MKPTASSLKRSTKLIRLQLDGQVKEREGQGKMGRREEIKKREREKQTQITRIRNKGDITTNLQKLKEL